MVYARIWQPLKIEKAPTNKHTLAYTHKLEAERFKETKSSMT